MLLLGSFFKPSLGLKQWRANKHRGGDRRRHGIYGIPWLPSKSWPSFPSIFKLGHLHVKDLTQLLSSAHVTTVSSPSYCGPVQCQEDTNTINTVCRWNRSICRKWMEQVFLGSDFRLLMASALVSLVPSAFATSSSSSIAL